MSPEKKKPGIDPKLTIAPLESTLEISRKPNELFIGIPKENSFQENRIALGPESVNILVNNGHRLVIQSNAGEGAHYYDADYSDAGAQIVYGTKEVFKADIIIKISPLTPEEIKLLKPGQTVISSIHLPTLKEDYIRQLMDRRVNALAFEYIKDDSGTFPLVRSMSEIAGNTAILIAAEFLSNLNHGKGVLLGGISGVPPVKVIILGAGVVGEFAARTAIGLGATVKIFDNNIYKLMRMQNNIGTRCFTSILQPKTLLQELKNCDVAVGAIHSEEGRTPIVVNEQMVAKMKAGSVIIDVSIDQGGCFETSEVTTHDEPTFKKYDVIHYCVPNIASRVARTTSNAISNVLTPTLLRASQMGGIEKLLWTDSGTRHGVYIFKGSLTNQHLSERFKIKFTDMDLLFAANI